MRGMILALALAVALLVAGCGGGGSRGGSVAGMPSGGGGGGTPTPTRGTPVAVGVEQLSLDFTPPRGTRLIGFSNETSVPTPPPVRYTRGDGVVIRQGFTLDGVHKSWLDTYRNQVTSFSYGDTSRDGPMSPFRVAPQVRVSGGSASVSSAGTQFLVTTVRLLNENLPFNRQIRIPGIAAPHWRNFASLTAYENAIRDTQPEGTIVVTILPRNHWSINFNHALGVEARLLKNGVRHASIIYLPADISLGVGGAQTAVHEAIHALGFAGHVSELTFPDSILNPRTDPIGYVAPRLIPEIDKAALQAMIMNTWGSWTNEREHLVGDIPTVGIRFGVISDNGLGRPFVTGPVPIRALLTDEAGVSGDATWEGAIVGFGGSRLSDRVTGDATLTIDLATAYTAKHDLDFDNIKYMETLTSAAGRTWRGSDGRDIGSLHYEVRLEASASSKGFHNVGPGVPGASRVL